MLDDWDGTSIVTSPDVDGLLSAALLAHTRGARLAGMYTTTSLVLFDDATLETASEALWLDHDISHPGVRCIGQHLVMHSPGDRLPRRHSISFNPNNFFGQTFQESFRGRSGRARDKYPFATIHFLVSCLGIERPAPSTDAYYLLAHADGSWVTPLAYRTNCEIWQQLMFDDGSITADLLAGYTDDSGNQSRHQALIERLRDLGIDRRTSRVGSNSAAPPAWRPLEGSQAIPFRRNMDPAGFLAKINDVLTLVAEATGWAFPLPSSVTNVVSGQVETPYPNSIRAGDFDAFMESEEIFSHAFTGFRTLRYTKGIALD